MNKLFPFSLALLLGFAPFAQAQTQAQSQPEETVRGFFNTRLASPSIGAPVGSELAEFSRFMSPELVCRLSAALRYNESFYHTYPDEPQPFAESDLYSSASSKPSQFSVGKPSLHGDQATVPVRFTLDATDSEPAREWEDQVQLRRISSRWRIVDIDYTGQISHEKPGSLSEKLESRLKSSRPVEGWSARELESCTMDPKAAPRRTSSKASSSQRHAGAHQATAKGHSAAASKSKSAAKSTTKSTSKAKSSAKAPAKHSTKSAASPSKKHHASSSRR